MNYIYEELEVNDKFEMLYNVVGPFNDFRQVIHCFMVAYREIEE
jgi:hypothetical protein